MHCGGFPLVPGVYIFPLNHSYIFSPVVVFFSDLRIMELHVKLPQVHED